MVKGFGGRKSKALTTENTESTEKSARKVKLTHYPSLLTQLQNGII
jgi:hypothetical protein